MAIDDADASGSGDVVGTGDGSDDGDPDDGPSGEEAESSPSVGEYTWQEFMEDHGYGDEVGRLYSDDDTADGGGLLGGGSSESPGKDWENVRFDPEEYLSFHPEEIEDRIEAAARRSKTVDARLQSHFEEIIGDARKGEYTWEHFKREFYYNEDGSRPLDSDGNVVPFEPEEYLGFDPGDVEGVLSDGENIASELEDLVDDRTVDVEEELDEDDFFSTVEGHTTVTNRYDLEKAVPMEKKLHFREVDRYWVNKPYAFVIIFHSRKENEKKYYLIEPYLNEIEADLQEFLSGKLRTAIKYSDEDVVVEGSIQDRASVIENETHRLLERYDLYADSGSDGSGIVQQLLQLFSNEEREEPDEGQFEGIEARPEPVILEEDPDTLTEYQVEKLLYRLKRNFIGYERIDGIKHDINVEDISCDGYNSPVFVYHTDYEQIISNVYHDEKQLDEFVVKLAQRSGKGISKRRPQVDATLPDGSRAQLTLGREVSDHGTNYTIRQFKDVPFTPIDLICWNTFSLDEMAYLWLCIENHKSLIFAGGTASGKTTSLNAISLFIPSDAKIVSIEDTREVELPQRNWIASVTRPSFSDDDEGDVDEFDLLEAALRQRPDYIVMGEIRGEEGRTLFQVMSTGHTTYTTFHADSVGEVLKRFTTEPINVSKTMFTALDLVSIQTQTRVQGNKVRRNKTLTEVNHYDAENDEINVQDVYQWQAETDEFLQMSESNTLEDIKFDRGWTEDKLESELFKRRVILAYLIKNGLNEYVKVAATVQAYINDPETILTLIANGQLEDSLEDLREMESVEINVDQEKEDLVPRPDPDDETYDLTVDILEEAEETLFDEFRGETPDGLASALGEMSEQGDIGAADQLDDDIEVDGELMGDTLDSSPFDFDSDDGFGFGATEETDDPDAETAIAGADSVDVETTADSGDAETATTDADSDADAPSWLTDSEETQNVFSSDSDDSSDETDGWLTADEEQTQADASTRESDTVETAPLERADTTASAGDQHGQETATSDEDGDAASDAGTAGTRQSEPADEVDSRAEGPLETETGTRVSSATGRQSDADREETDSTATETSDETSASVDTASDAIETEGARDPEHEPADDEGESTVTDDEPDIESASTSGTDRELASDEETTGTDSESSADSRTTDTDDSAGFTDATPADFGLSSGTTADETEDDDSSVQDRSAVDASSSTADVSSGEEADTGEEEAEENGFAFSASDGDGIAFGESDEDDEDDDDNGGVAFSDATVDEGKLFGDDDDGFFGNDESEPSSKADGGSDIAFDPEDEESPFDQSGDESDDESTGSDGGEDDESSMFDEVSFGGEEES